MSANSIGKNLVLTSFGESHGALIGAVLDGFPSNFEVDLDAIQIQLQRRKPGQSHLSTPRKEDDIVEIVSGIFERKTLGTPITFLIKNTDTKPKDYDKLKDVYRPGHADALWQTKMGNRDHRGGGRSSARVTAGWVAAGALAEQYLASQSIKVVAWVEQIHTISSDHPETIPTRSKIDSNPVRCADQNASKKMEEAIIEAKENGDSLGGIIRVNIQGVPAGVGSPLFRKLQALLSYYTMNINAVKGIYFGTDEHTHLRKGSENNDEWVQRDNGIGTKTNRSGGIIGGMATGEEIEFQVYFKPTSSIKKPQSTVDVHGNEVSLAIEGRHDPCVLPRAVPIVEAMSALAVMDVLLD